MKLMVGKTNSPSSIVACLRGRRFYGAAFLGRMALAALSLGLLSAEAADYATSGNIDYASTSSAPAVFLGETPQGPYTWTHTGKFFMYAGGLLQSLADLATTTPAKLTLKDATVTVSSDFTVASGGTVDSEPVGGSGELVLDNTEMTVNGIFSVNNQNVLGGNKPSNPVVGRLTLKNNSTLAVGGTFNISANAAAEEDWNASVTNVIVLSDTSTLKLNTDVKRYDGPSGCIVFDGGRIVQRSSGNGIFGAYGYGRPLSALVITNTPGHDVRVENSYTNNLFGGQSMGFLLADGAIEKGGRGVLVFNGPSSNNGWVDRLAFNGLNVREGEVLLYNNYTFRDPNTFPQYRRGAVEIAVGARLNLNNNDAFIEDLAGFGTIYASDETGANLMLCNSADVQSSVKLGKGLVNVVKREDSLTQVVPFGMDAAALSVNAGTLKFVDSPTGARGYTHYRFRVLNVNDSNNANQIMELREVKLFEGEADVTYAAQFTYDATTTQEGGTGIFGNNELPPKAIDMNLNSKWCDLRYASQNCWWIEFVYATPVQVTSYNWAKTDNMYRSPREWVLEGSDDGIVWTELSHETLDTRYLANNEWVSATPFATSLAGTQVSCADSVHVAHGATLDMTDYSGRFETKSVSGNVVVGDSASVVLKVDEGTTRLVPMATSAKYFRWTIKATRSAQNVMECGKFYLYDTNGVPQNIGLEWNQEHGTSAKDLAAGSFCQGGNYKYSIWNGDYQDPTRLFRVETDYNKWCTTEHTFRENDESTWYVINMRLADDANPIAAYNIRTVGSSGDVDTSRPIAAWSLEYSEDGETWMLFDAQSIGTDAPTKAATWYNGGMSYGPGDGFVDNVSQSPSANTIVAMHGGTLDTSAAPGTKIGAIEVDPSCEGSAITYFNPAANGVLRIVNAGVSWSVGTALPVAVTGCPADANTTLASWRVVVDGREYPIGTRRVKVSDGMLWVDKVSGFAIFIR